jgi:hypothetical protein
MALDDKRRVYLAELGRQLLTDLETVAAEARSRVTPGGRRPPEAIAGGTNAMVDGHSALREVAAVTADVRAHLERLTREPFVARIVVRWEDETNGERETLYVTRASAAGVGSVLAGARIVTYQSLLGRVAEVPPGTEISLPFAGRTREAVVEQRLRLRPDQSAGQWDAIDDSFEFEDWKVAVRSVRQFLEEAERSGLGADEVEDILGALLLRGAEAASLREQVRRQAIRRIALRDQPILDRHQGEAFRLPINRRLILLGPPGTGKTTTLIRRLAQKRMREALAEDEIDELRRVGLAEAVEQSSSWVMFSPTELLKLYLGDAFSSEGVPAPPENLRTWDRERARLGRGVLRILRSGETRGFQFDGERELLRDPSSPGTSLLHDTFSDYFTITSTEKVTGAYERVRRSPAVSAKAKSRLLTVMGTRGESGIGLASAARLLDGVAELQEELKQITDGIDREALRLGNRLLRQHPTLLQELVASGQALLVDDGRVEDEDDDLDAEESTSGLGRGFGSSRALDPESAAQLLVAAVRRRAVAIFAGRTNVSGRAGRVLEILGDRLPSRVDLESLGERILARADLRTLVRSPRAFVMGAPAAYARFRRDELRAGRFFVEGAAESVREQRITGPEVDIVALVMLRNTRLLLQENGWRVNVANDWLNGIVAEHRLQVFVDEATDFSAVQLACTMELSEPRLRAWFACGDFNQRITEGGVRAQTEFRWLEKSAGASVDIRAIKVGYRQSASLRELMVALATDDSAVPEADPEAPEHEVRPLLLEGVSGLDVAEWTGQRIVEIERAIGSVPSIAIFVNGEELIAPTVEALRPILAGQNVEVIGCPDGRSVGDAQEVRVFNVQHIKGLEFEAVFFLAIDRLAERIPTLFERYLLVGMSRAATYLALTCEDHLPSSLEALRPHLATGAWN